MVNGCVKGADGKLLSGLTVHGQGINYIGASTATTNPDGSFSISVKQDARVFLFAENTDGSKRGTVEISARSEDIDFPTCLDFGRQSTSVKLSWGQTPKDLDAHLVGPTGLHIFFSVQVSLNNPPFIHLDIDDLLSFGAEIMTIARLEAGTYTYSVANFSEEPSITSSPTRVELNLKGLVHLFTPPSGEGSNLTWNVFEPGVDTNKNITLNRLDTWQPRKL